MSKKRSDFGHFQTSENTSFSAVQELIDSEKYLTSYSFSLIKRISRVVGKKTKVLEFGAGIGNLANLWYQINKVKPDCLEIDESFSKILINRGFSTYNNVSSLSKKYEVIYSSNVLEHIQNDCAAIKSLYKKLDNDGLLIIYVPAFMVLFSEFDRSAGHYRRYGKSELIEKLKRENFYILKVNYVDCLGFIAAFLVKILGYKNEFKLGSKRSLKFYDRYIWPLSNYLDRLGFKYIFGKNLFVVAKKVR